MAINPPEIVTNVWSSVALHRIGMSINYLADSRGTVLVLRVPTLEFFRILPQNEIKRMFQMSPSNLHRCWPPPVSVSQIQSNAHFRWGWSLVSPAESPVETTSFAPWSGPPSTLRAGKVTPKIICSGVGAGALPMIPRKVVWGCVEPFKTFWNLLCYVLLYHSWRGWTSICRLA